LRVISGIGRLEADVLADVVGSQDVAGDRVDDFEDRRLILSCCWKKNKKTILLFGFVLLFFVGF
jgi:hypothetical protein